MNNIEMPKNIKLAIRLLWANLILSIVNGVFSIIFFSKISSPIHLPHELAAGIITSKSLLINAVITLIVSALIQLLLIRKILKQRNWARIVVLISTVLGVIGILVKFGSLFNNTGITEFSLAIESILPKPVNLIITTIATLMTLLQLTATYLLFSKQGRLWFAKSQQIIVDYKSDLSTKWLKGFLLGHIATIFLSILVLIILGFNIANKSNLFSLSSGMIDEKTMALIDKYIPIIKTCVVFYIVTFLLSIIFFICWVYKANVKAQQLTTTMRFGKWSIIWFFIPIFNLWKPYQIVKEISQVAKDPARWQEQKAPKALKWWWFFFVTSPLWFMINPALYVIAEVIYIFCFLSLLKRINYGLLPTSVIQAT